MAVTYLLLILKPRPALLYHSLFGDSEGKEHQKGTMYKMLDGTEGFNIQGTK